MHGENAAEMNKAGPGFEKVIASLDGDLGLFAEIAGPVAVHYAAYADQIESLAAAGSHAAIAQVVHKVKSSWTLYAIGYPDLPDRLDAAIRAGDIDMITRQAHLLSSALRTVSRDLESWVKCHPGKNN